MTTGIGELREQIRDLRTQQAEELALLIINLTGKAMTCDCCQQPVRRGQLVGDLFIGQECRPHYPTNYPCHTAH